MKFESLVDNRILVIPDPVKDKEHGLILPDTAKKNQCTGTVLITGPGRASQETGVRLPMNTKPGDRVLYTHFSGTPFEVEGYTDKLILMTENEIIAVLEKE